MKVELKNFKHLASLSEETNAFTADVFVNGKKIAYAKNTGNGGCNDIYPYPNNRTELDELEKHVKTLPSKYNYPMNLDMFIGDMVYEKLVEGEKKKVIAKLKKDCARQIILVNESQYQDFLTSESHIIDCRRFKISIPYSKLSESQRTNLLNQAREQLKSGEVILNEII